MNNQAFIDIMDKVNAFAKQLGHTNGIAWARSQKEKNRLSEYDYHAFEGCHDLRNLMAHGFAKDINVSAETLQKARLFLSVMSKPYTSNGQCMIFNSTNGFSELEVQKGDYVIVIREEFRGWSKKTESELYQVNADKSFKDLKWGYSVTYDTLLDHHRYYLDINRGLSYYVVRADLSAYLLPKFSFYVSAKPVLYKDNQGNSWATITFYKDSNALNSSTINVRCYLAHVCCLRKDNPALLYDIGSNETEDWYLSRNDHENDLDGDLPF